jgi:hypothetical protein
MAAPTVLSRLASSGAASNAVNYTPTLPTVTTGKALLAVISSDGNPVLTTTSAGWEKLGQSSNGANVTQAVFLKRVATGSDGLTTNSTVGEQYSASILCIDAGAIFDVAVEFSNGSSTNSDPPNLALYASLDALLIATRSGDAAVQPTAVPSGYANNTANAGSGSAGAAINTAERTATVSSENPGVWTVATEQWVCSTIAIWTDTTTRWSAGDRNAGVTLSNSNRTATANVLPTAVNGVRATLGRSTGKYVFGFTPTVDAPNVHIGLANAAQDLAVSTNTGTNAFNFHDSSGVQAFRFNGATTSTGISTAVSTLHLVAVDIDAELVWLKVGAGNWNGSGTANPDTGVGGYSFSAMAAGMLFPMFGAESATAAGTFDGNPTHSLSTFDPWDGASGAASLAMPLLSSGAVTFAPVLAPQAVSVVLPVAGSTSAIYAPAVSLPPVTVAVPVIGSSGSLHALSVAPQPIALALPALSSSGALYGLTLAPQAVAISVPLVASATVTYAPVLALTLQPPLLASTASTFAPLLAPGAVAIAAPLLASTTNFYAPGLSAQGATVLLPLLASTAQMHAPALAPQAISLTLPLVSSGSSLFTPSLGVSSLGLSLPVLTASGALHQPALAAQAVAVETPLILSAAVVHAPTLSPQATTVSLPPIGSAAVLHPPLLASQATAILLPVLVSAAIAYPPSLAAQLVTDLVRRVTGRASGTRLLGRAGAGQFAGASGAGAATGSASGRRLTGRAARGDI